MSNNIIPRLFYKTRQYTKHMVSKQSHKSTVNRWFANFGAPCIIYIYIMDNLIRGDCEYRFDLIKRCRNVYCRVAVSGLLDVTRTGNDGVVLSGAPKSTWHIAVHRADSAFAARASSAGISLENLIQIISNRNSGPLFSLPAGMKNLRENFPP